MTPAGRVADSPARAAGTAWSGRPALWVSLSVLPTVAACWALQPWLAGSSLAVSLLTQMAWLAIVLLANNLLLGQCGLLSFGHALQVGAGALGAVLAMRWGASGGSIPLPLVPLVGMLPVTANGLGLAEGAFVLFYTQMGVPADQAFAAALLRRLVTIGVSLPGCAMWLGVGRAAAGRGALGEPT